MMEAKCAAVEEIYSDEEHSDVSCHGRKKQPSDSEDEFQHESETDTTVYLNSGVGDNVLSTLSAGTCFTRTHYAPMGALLGEFFGKFACYFSPWDLLWGVFFQLQQRQRDPETELIRSMARSLNLRNLLALQSQEKLLW